jgi:hypothetical protein
LSFSLGLLVLLRERLSDEGRVPGQLFVLLDGFCPPTRTLGISECSGRVDKSPFAMADGGMLLIFRSMTTEELLAMKEKLMAQFLALGPYGGQTVGSKSWTKDTRGMQSQLEAISFVLAERSAGGYDHYYVMDFSRGANQGQPAGTNDQLSY